MLLVVNVLGEGTEAKEMPSIVRKIASTLPVIVFLAVAAVAASYVTRLAGYNGRGMAIETAMGPELARRVKPASSTC